jgi:antitoxin component YwqK of YwqJK toxin-antitoxin module
VEANYRGGLLHGEMTFYSADGSIRSVMNFEDGRLIAAPIEEGRGEANASSF